MGFLAAALSAIFSSSKDLISKKLTLRMDGTLSTFASFAFALPFYVVLWGVLWWLGLEDATWSGWFWLYVGLRSVTDCFAEGMKMHAFGHGDISVVTLFFSISPLFLLIWSPIITGDPLSVWSVVATILVVLGSFLIVYRPADRSWREQRKGILLAMCASLFFSLNSCFDKLAVREGTPVFSGFTMTLVSALLILPLIAFRSGNWQNLAEQQRGLWWRGLLEILFMSCKLFALQYLSAPDAVGIQRLSLLFTILGGWLFFGEKDIVRRLAAAGLIVAGVGVIGQQSASRPQPEVALPNAETETER